MKEILNGSHGKEEICVPKIIREKLIYLRDNYSNEIPEKMIHGYEHPGQYKVLRSWWTAVIPYLGLGLDENVIKEKRLRRKVEGFYGKYTSRTFWKQDRTTSKDIKRANRMINLVLEKL